jgi:RHS repeat-associated protein
VQTTGSNATPSVQYRYDDGAGAAEGTGVAASYVRLTDLIYPTESSPLNARDVQYGYDVAGAVDDIMSRIGSISDSSGELATYAYLGTDTVVQVSYPEPGMDLNYCEGNAFLYWDQFGDVVNQDWRNNQGHVFDDSTYTYDQSGNRLTRANLLDAALSETYTYDGLDRLTSVVRNGTETEAWTLDSLGNFMDSAANGVSQSRTTDASNEIQSITQGGTASAQGYDAAGNMTTIADPNNPSGTLTCTFDVWNRLTQVADSSGNIIAQYQYDGSGRLVEELSNFTGTTPGTVTYSFYDGQNAIETRQGTVSSGVVPTASSLSPQYQYVFSPMSGKTPILRDSTFGAETGVPTSAGRLYYTSDANTNVTAVVGLSGGTWQTVERYDYSAYGQVTFCDASWNPLTSGNNSTTTPGVSSAVGNNTLYASMVLDPRTGLFNDLHRWYDAWTSTFVSQDPIKADENLYRYCGNMPTEATDASGLKFIVRRWRRYATGEFEGDSGPATIASLDANLVPLMVQGQPHYAVQETEALAWKTMAGANLANVGVNAGPPESTGDLKKLLGPQAGVAFAGGLFVITADVETDDLSDGGLGVHEVSTLSAHDTGEWKQYDQSDEWPRAKGTPVSDFSKGEVSGATAVRIKTPPNHLCEYRVIFVDAPCVAEYVKTNASCLVNVTQTVVITDKSTKKDYSITQKFSFGIGPDVPFTFTPGTSTVGE